LQPGQQISVTTASLASESRPAAIYFTGREVDPQSNAIPLIAIVDNTDGRLRPGMPAHMTLPSAASRQVLSIPEAAVMQHDGRTFVFVPTAEDSFQPTDVVIGQTVAGTTEVVSGLTRGTQVVSQNAFLLKSELLLQGEDD
jgi:cobalt-zinc-cadmium efflux system membrane fusion protein